MNALGIGMRVYCACVDFELRVAKLLAISYRDVNAGLFFVLWPLVTVGLLGLVIHQRRVLRRLERGQVSSSAARGLASGDVDASSS